MYMWSIAAPQKGGSMLGHVPVGFCCNALVMSVQAPSCVDWILALVALKSPIANERGLWQDLHLSTIYQHDY